MQETTHVGPSLLACLKVFNQSRYAGLFHHVVVTTKGTEKGNGNHVRFSSEKPNQGSGIPLFFWSNPQILWLRLSFHDALFWLVSRDQTQMHSSEMSTSNTPGPRSPYRSRRELLPLNCSQTAASRTGVILGIHHALVDCRIGNAWRL